MAIADTSVYRPVRETRHASQRILNEALPMTHLMCPSETSIRNHEVLETSKGLDDVVTGGHLLELSPPRARGATCAITPSLCCLSALCAQTLRSKQWRTGYLLHGLIIVIAQLLQLRQQNFAGRHYRRFLSLRFCQPRLRGHLSCMDLNASCTNQCLF